MTAKRVLALFVGLSLLLGLVACDFAKAKVPSDEEVEKAVEEEYDMKLNLVSGDIAGDESEAEWVFVDKDYSFRVTVTWSSKNPGKLDMTDEELADIPSGSDVQMAVERDYGKSFYIDRMSISKDGDEAEWIFVSMDGLIEVTVTWNKNYPDRFDYSDRVIQKDDSDVQEWESQYKFGKGSETIKLWSYSSEVSDIIEKFMDMNPDFGDKYTVEVTLFPTDSGFYDTILDQALLAGENKAPDIFMAEAPVVTKYTQGEMSSYVATYKDLGIDVDNLIESADIANYVVDVGTRGKDVVALSYQATSGVMIYRASIAREVFGTDDPELIGKIMGSGSGNWDNFLSAAEVLKSKGYPIVAGFEDVWQAYQGYTSASWLDADNRIVVSPEREQFFDLAKTLVENGYTDNANSWSEDWYKDMQNADAFCYFGPSWLINWVIMSNCGGTKTGEGTYGDWRICESPVSFFWGGNWVFANKFSRQKEGIGEIIEWITLDTSETGLQYLWANDMMGYGAPEAVISNTVLNKSAGEFSFCGGQDIFAVFTAANEHTYGKCITPYDENINLYYIDMVKEYAYGSISKDAAIEEFKDNVYAYVF